MSIQLTSPCTDWEPMKIWSGTLPPGSSEMPLYPAWPVWALSETTGVGCWGVTVTERCWYREVASCVCDPDRPHWMMPVSSFAWYR